MCLFVVALGAAGDATHGPVHVGQALYQLSYIPALHFNTGFHHPGFENLLFAFLGVGLVLGAMPCILASLRPNIIISSLSISPKGVRSGHSLVKLMTDLIPSPCIFIHALASVLRLS